MKDLVAEQGILCSVGKKKGRSLDLQIEESVCNFYREPDVSKELPGKKDCKSVKNGDERVIKQKRLILGNLREIYSLFNERYPNLKIGFSKFASLRPPECVLAGAPGTHTVCVCAIHQNFKLKFEGASFGEILTNEGQKVFESYRELLKYNLCDNPTESCFSGKCTKRECGDLSKLEEIFNSHIDTNFLKSDAKSGPRRNGVV